MQPRHIQLHNSFTKMVKTGEVEVNKVAGDDGAEEMEPPTEAPPGEAF